MVSSTGQAAGHRDPARPGLPEAPLALYRRYRPATFAEVKGQEHVTEPLRQALRTGRVHHAYLFSGPRGCGKTSSARILARSLNCEEGPTPDPCGVCASCVALAPSGPGSIDVIEIDAASHGGIDDARDLRERAFYSPVAARYKIYIIDEAHMVTGGGFNALLKLVEEPPPHLKFVFATTEPEKVIATIRSRTHHYPFRLVPPAVLRELLEEILRSERISYEPAVLPVVIRAGTGSVRDSLSVLDQLMAGADESGLRYDRAIALLGYTDDALLDEMAEAFAAADGAAIFRTIDRVVEAGHDPRRFAADLLDRLRDLIILAAVPDAGATGLLDAPQDRLARMRQQATAFGQDRLVRAAETVNAGLVEMRGATSPRLLLELMCAQVLLPAGPAADGGLAARVDRLERRVGAHVSSAANSTAQRPDAQVSAPRGRREQGSGPEHSVRPGQEATTDQEQGSRAERGSGPRRDEAGARASGGSGAAGPDSARSIAEQVPDPDPAPSGGTVARRDGPARPSSGGQVVGPLDTDALRHRWPEVIDAVKGVSRVAWILLSNATLESAQDGVLTLAFEREGDAKGFASSGSGDFLAKVLDTMFGVRLTVRTTVQPAAGNGGTGSRAPGGSDRLQAAGADDAVRASEGVAASAPDVARTSGLGADGAETAGTGSGAAGEASDSAVVSGGAHGSAAGRSRAVGSQATADAPASPPALAAGSGAGGSASGHSPGPTAQAESAARRSGGQRAGGPTAQAESAAPGSGGQRSGGPTAQAESAAPGSGGQRAGGPTAQAESAGPRSAAQRAGGPARRPHVSAPDADDPRPLTDATPTGEGAGDLLTGPDLIERALGGRMIGEISDG